MQLPCFMAVEVVVCRLAPIHYVHGAVVT